MRIGILEAGKMLDIVASKHGHYLDLYTDLLHQADPTIETFGVKVVDGVMPSSVHAADGWLISGSRNGVYDGEPWIDALSSFLRACVSAQVPVVGICFGHQLLAQALGGQAAKYDGGWALGVHDYTPVEPLDWAPFLSQPWQGHAMHQDQVISPPEDTTLLATSNFCANAALAYGALDKPYALSVQSHPEFSAALVEDMIVHRLDGIIPAPIIEQARARGGQAVANQEWAKVLVTFFKRHQSQQNAAA